MTQMLDQQAILRAVCRQDLNAFFEKSFGLVCPDTHYSHNWHIDAIAHHLTEVMTGTCNRLIITMPPRSLKSHCVSVAFPAFLLGQDPSKKIINVSYSQELSDKLARDSKALIEHEFYRDLFPATRIDRKKTAVSEFATTRRGFRLATSLGGTLTGRGGDIIILDDPMKPEDVLSDAIRKRGLDWFGNTLLSRLDNKEAGSIILVMQRLHEEDLAGYLLEQGGWTHLNLPAIAEEEQYIPIGPKRVHHRRHGDVLHPSRESRAILDHMRSEMGSYDFAAQYQQNPAPKGGGLVQLSWFNWYENPRNELDDEVIVQSWDTAFSAETSADYSVCATFIMGKDEGGVLVYDLLDVFRKQLIFPDLIKNVRVHSDHWKPQHILIENKGSGQSLIQELKREHHMPVKAIDPKHDKITRMRTATPVIENGRVFLPKQAIWLDEYKMELSRFPRGRHDDQVDATSQFLNWAEHGCGRTPRQSMGFIAG